LKQKKAQEEENIKLMEEKHLKDKLKAEFWNTKIIPYWSKMKNSKNIKKYFYEGIPTSTRGKIWALCIGNKFSITKEYYDIEANKSIQLIIKLNKINRTKLSKITNPYISVCFPIYNMEKYLERALLSIINQSFQNFEIILVNDNSNYNTQNIIKKYMSYDNRIKLINHNQNLGVYCSRVDAVTNSIGEFVILMDPDDMILNQDLFLELYNYNLKHNLDIIEFSVYHKEEKRTKIYYPDNHQSHHYHGFEKIIIYQPELSNIIFFNPISKNYSSIICRTIWNKLIRKTILIKSIEYIDVDFNNQYLIKETKAFRRKSIKEDTERKNEKFELYKQKLKEKFDEWIETLQELFSNKLYRQVLREIQEKKK